MKRIILAFIALTFFVAAEAQTKTKTKKKAKKTYVSSESRAKAKEKAELARIQLETEKKIQDYRTTSLLTDSLRIDSERVARENFETERKTYLDTRYREIDSTNKASWKKFGEEKEQWSKTEQSLDAINKAAKLDSYESRQVKAINQAYYDKAKEYQDNTTLTEEQRKQQLTTLNAESAFCSRGFQR